MKSIQKGKEPNSLIEYRAGQTQPYSRNVFDDFAHKDELRLRFASPWGRKPAARTGAYLLLLYETDYGEHDED